MADQPFLASNSFNGDGTTVVWEFSFEGLDPGAGPTAKPYIDSADVHAELITGEGDAQVTVQTPYLFESLNSIRVEPAVPLGTVLRIYRETENRFPLVNYQDLQSVGASDLDLANRQAVYIVQEARDAARGAGNVSAETLALAAGSAQAAEDSAAAAQESAEQFEAYREANNVRFMANGFVPLGDYTSGLEFTTYNQYMARDGFFYRPAPSSIPFTTTGTWVGGDEDLFNLFSADDVLRQDLADAVDPEKGVTLVGGALRSVASISELRGFPGDTDGRTISLTGWYEEEPGLGAGTFYWDASSTAVDDGGLVIAVTGVVTGRWRRVYPHTSMARHVVNAAWFGVSESLSDNGSLLNSLMANTDIEGVDVHSGSFNIITPVVIPSYIKHFKGVGKRLTKFVQDAADAPANVISSSNGLEYADYGDFEVSLKISTTGNEVSTALRMLGARRTRISNIHVEVVGHTDELYSGVGVILDMQAVANAYTNHVEGVSVIGTTVGIWSKGPLTSSVFTRNHLKCLSTMRFSREAVQAGTTPIVGNQIFANLLQAHSSATFGMGNGIDWGYGDGALGFTFAFSNQMWGNYIERFEHGIIFRSGAKNNEVGSQEWDSPTNKVTDLNTSLDGYSGLDAQAFHIALRDVFFKAEKTGMLIASKPGTTFWHNGVNKTHDLAVSTSITCSDARRIVLNPNGANRTGVVLDTTNCEEGQILILYTTDTTYFISLSATNLLLNNTTSVVMGNEAAGRARRMEFELVINEVGAKRWMETSRNVKPA